MGSASQFLPAKEQIRCLKITLQVNQEHQTAFYTLLFFAKKGNSLMKFDNVYTSEIELTDVDLRSIYGGSGNGNGSGNSGVVDALNGVLDGNDIGVAVNALGFQKNDQETTSIKKSRSDDDD